MIKGDIDKYKALKEKCEDQTIIWSDFLTYVEEFSHDKIQQRLVAFIRYLTHSDNRNISDEDLNKLMEKIVIWP